MSIYDNYCTIGTYRVTGDIDAVIYQTRWEPYNTTITTRGELTNARKTFQKWLFLKFGFCELCCLLLLVLVYYLCIGYSNLKLKNFQTRVMLWNIIVYFSIGSIQFIPSYVILMSCMMATTSLVRVIILPKMQTQQEFKSLSVHQCISLRLYTFEIVMVLKCIPTSLLTWFQQYDAVLWSYYITNQHTTNHIPHD